MKKTLNGNWFFKSTDSGNWKPATVPGCNYLDLLSNGDIPDPFVGTHENNVQWIAEKDWEYKHDFELSEDDLLWSEILLNCEMLDTICEIFINGKSAGKGENCHRTYSFDVKDKLFVGINEIRIIFCSPKNYVSEMHKNCPTPANSNGQNGIVHIRKPQYHFGWDWGPVLTPSGISGNIELEFRNGGYIENIKIKQKHSHASVSIKVDALICNLSDENCKISVLCPNGEVLISSGTSAEFIIENPELWWTRELSEESEQPLYEISAELSRGDEKISAASKKIGLRTLELNRQKDKWGFNFQFILNGVPLFIKGANYIPPDSFMNRFNSERLNKLLDAVSFSNMNMLRVWGGGFYGSDELFDECDKRGILIWQDFAFACQAYPFFDNAFLKNVLAEVEHNVKRLAHHPSLALWCGNNEIEDMHSAWLHMPNYIEWTEKFFYHILPEKLREFDEQTPYTPGSPIGTKHNKDVGADFVGDTHLWGVWHGLQPMTYYRKRFTRFCSEFGFESLPDMKTINAFANPSERNLSSGVMKAHQKCHNGNDKMLHYIASRFKLPKGIADIVYFSQAAQQECIADATEHWRRNRGRCNGAIYWQLNDCWPVCSWSGYDYFGNYKALQYKAKWFNAPLSISIEGEENHAGIFLLNDLNRSETVSVEYVIFDFFSGAIRSETKQMTIEATKSKKIFEIALNGLNKKRTGIAARLCQNGRLIMQKTLVLLPEKKLELPQARIQRTVEADENEIKIILKSNCFARLVQLENDSTLPFSDNYFDLLPNEAKVITQAIDGVAEQVKSLTVRSICDVQFIEKPLKAEWKRIKVYFSPVNIANAIYHGKVPKE